MSVQQCCGIEQMFDTKAAAAELARYRRQGPRKSTRLLTERIAAEGVRGATVLDIGAGTGAAHYALLEAGARSAVDVDASAALLAAAQEEAGRRGLGDRVTHLHGNFVDIARSVPASDVVILDRVICCYDDVDSLVRLSTALTRRLYGLVYPLDAWWARLSSSLLNLFSRVKGCFYRSYIHPLSHVEELLRSAGLTERFSRRSGMWRVAVYAKG